MDGYGKSFDRLIVGLLARDLQVKSRREFTMWSNLEQSSG